MSFSVESFVEAPALSSLTALKRSDLLALADHYKLEITSGMRKNAIRTVLIEHLIDEEIVSEDETVGVETTSVVELKRLELREREKERESQLRLKELEFKERELAMQLRIKELELAADTPTSASGRREFDASKQIRFVPPFQEAEVDKYFLHFEKIASSLEWPKEMWTLLLQSVLLGKARETYSALSVDHSSDYDIVKSAILKAYELVPEAYRQKFRTSQKIESQTYVEFARIKETLFDRWCTSKEVNDFDRLRELVLLEEFKSCIPAEIQTYLDEQRVDTLHQAAVRADDYSLTHKVAFRKAHPQPFDHTEKRPGEGSAPSNAYGSGQSTPGDRMGSANANSPWLPAGPTCFYCKKRGHIMSECRALEKKNKKTTSNALVVSSLSPPINAKSEFEAEDFPKEYLPFLSQGFVSFVGSSDEVPIVVLRDTGASQSLMLESVLPFGCQSDTGMTVLLQGVELNILNVPLHEVFLKSNLITGPVVVGVRPSLPVRKVSLILGNDLAGEKVVGSPYVSSIPYSGSEEKSVEGFPELFTACAVTRAMSRAAQCQADTDSPVEREDTLEGLANPFLCNDNEGHSPSAMVPVLEDPLRKSTGGRKEAGGCASLSHKALIAEQERDPEIICLGRQALDEKEAAVVPCCYFKKEGILMRKWRPPEAPASHDWKVVYQVVIPQKHRHDILSIAHESPMAGHLGIKKTYQKVLNHFYWPGMQKDVKDFCRTCHTCQVIGKPNQKPPAAPLKPIPVSTEPFSHVIIDCVGPLPKTKEGNQYLLTIMCSSTRFPEAIPLRNIKAPKIAKALIKFFTLFGLPKSVQSDQGSNFMSHLFQDVMAQLGIKQVKASAYHPQSQGALERFHQTLKTMMRSYCLQEKKDWDEGIPLLLFAAREAVQESLGFSPFELVFGHTPRGPLKLLKERWLSDEEPESVLVRISDIRHRLRTANELAQKNLKAAQSGMKTWYDRKARTRVFKPGDQVLVLLPVHSNPLQARYCGPFTIAEKVNEVDYIVNTTGRRKARRLCHVNMLKGYENAEPNSCKSVSIVTPLVGDLPDLTSRDGPAEDESRRDGKLQNSDVLQNLEDKLSHLPKEEKDAIVELVHKFALLFPDVPGKTICACHDVDVGDARPIKQHAYRVNPTKLAALRKEVQYMLHNGIVKPSQSQWSSPCVLVPKADGSYRFCTDFRRVNAVTKSDSYPLPRIDDCIDSIGHARYVTKFDLLKGYWQVPLTTRAREISAFVTPDGLYEYTVMPFGMKNAPATFQRMINQVIMDLEGCQAYIDDVIVYSNNWDQHIKQLHAFLCRLQEARLTVNLVKTEFGHARVEFLGHVVGQGQVTPVAAKVEAISKFPVPTNQRELMRFLGMAGYYRKFCHNFSTLVEPLTNLLRKGMKYTWSTDCQESFEKIKSILLSTPVLVAPNFQKQFKLFVDASDIGCGAVLLQEDSRGVDHPVCYYSRKFNCHQRNYCTGEKETLALLLSLQHFDVYLGSTVVPVQVFTDHNPLVFINRMKNNNQRLLRWSLALQEYNLEIEHIKGKENVMADALSRAM